MLLFVIEKALPPHSWAEWGAGTGGGGELLLDVLISAESAISGPHSLLRWVPLDQDMSQSAITRREKVEIIWPALNTFEVMKQLNVIWSKLTALFVFCVITKKIHFIFKSLTKVDPREDKMMLSTRIAGVKVNEKGSRKGLGCSFALGENNDVQFLK